MTTKHAQERDAAIAPSQSLFTDLYELTMAQAYWQSGQTGPGTFSLFLRNYPSDRAYFVFAGLAVVLFANRAQRCIESARPMGIKTVPHLSIRKMTRRWGSCTQSGTILLNLAFEQANPLAIGSGIFPKKNSKLL
jgi:nicotinate phosphoribosyltransferase family protein/metallopeptidase YgjP-like protein